MATIWPYKREECSEIPTLSFNPETKVDPDGEDKFIVIQQTPDLTEFTLSVTLPNKVSNYYGRNKKRVKVDYCAVVVNKETRSRSMQKMTVKGSSNIIALTSDLTKPLPREIFCLPSAVRPEALLLSVEESSSIFAIS